MKPLRALRRFFMNIDRSAQLLAEIREGIANLNPSVQVLREIREGVANQDTSTSQVLTEIREGIANLNPHVQEIRNAIQLLRVSNAVNSNPIPNSNPSSEQSRSPRGPRPIMAVDARGNSLTGPKEITFGSEDSSGDYPASSDENRLEKFCYIYEEVLKPREFEVPPGYVVDFMGILIDGRFQAASGIDPSALPGGHIRQKIPTLKDNDRGDGEWWFEVVDWFVAAQEARGQFVMISLGASYGAQSVGAYTAMRMVNPLPAKLIAVEADPESCNWIRQHFRDNGIDPDDHWIVQAAVSDTNDPVLFPIGAPGLGSNNCVGTNEPGGRDIFIRLVHRDADPIAAFENLVRYGSTGLMQDLGEGFTGEVKYVSAVTLADLLAQVDKVDLLECDIQQSEIVALPPYLDLLRRKVKRLHIGTHGLDIHRTLLRKFAKAGWEVVFNYQPNSMHASPWGPFRTNDGILTLKNPDL
jgi:hypothetical protein